MDTFGAGELLNQVRTNKSHKYLTSFHFSGLENFYIDISTSLKSNRKCHETLIMRRGEIFKKDCRRVISFVERAVAQPLKGALFGAKKSP